MKCPCCREKLAPGDNQVIVNNIDDDYALASLCCPSCDRAVMVALIRPQIWTPINGPDSSLNIDKGPVCQHERCHARYDLIRCWNEKTSPGDLGNVYCREHAAAAGFCPMCGKSISADYGDGPPDRCDCAGADAATA